jgi:hypothetical protein
MSEFWKEGILSLDSEGKAQRKADYARCKTELLHDLNLEPMERQFLLEQLSMYSEFLKQEMVREEADEVVRHYARQGLWGPEVAAEYEEAKKE